MSIPSNMRAELEKRDELILALEMRLVDQACRQLALEAVGVNMAEAGKVKAADVKARIAQESKRIQQHFEGEGVTGIVARAQRLALELKDSAKGSTTAKVVKKKQTKKAK